MIIFTALWIGGILFGGAMGFWAVMSQYERAGGGYMVNENGSHYRSGEVLAGAMIMSFFTGLVCPTVIYAIAMTALVVIHFASKNLTASDPQLRR